MTPWPAAARPREPMISVWYPAHDDDRYPWAPWMSPTAGKLFRTRLIPPPLGTGPLQPPPAASAPPVPLDKSSRLPPAPGREHQPIFLHDDVPSCCTSPRYRDDWELDTGLVSGLASRGYIVVTTGYTYEAAEMEFPGGRVETGRQTELPEAVEVRIADTQTVLDERAVLNSGTSPDAGHRRLPAGLRGNPRSGQGRNVRSLTSAVPPQQWLQSPTAGSSPTSTSTPASSSATAHTRRPGVASTGQADRRGNHEETRRLNRS